MAENTTDRRDDRWTVDVRDVMAGAGVVLVLVGAWVIHPGLVVVAAGCSLCGAAWYLAKRRKG